MNTNKSGFALIEILIALTILSIALLSVFSGVSASINVISGSKNLTRAMLIANTKLNEFEIDNMRGLDVSNEPVDEYPGFYFSRVTEPYEHSYLEAVNIKAKLTKIIVTWKDRNRDRQYSVSYIYPSI
ncbi:prepilin-type N-terminal cleavage/methylation domain-containing protein [Spirochaetota bacterium]